MSQASTISTITSFSENMFLVEGVTDMSSSPLSIPECLSRIFEFLWDDKNSLTYFACFDDQIQWSFIRNWMLYPIIDKSPSHPTLFDYPSFLRQLDLRSMFSLINTWFVKTASNEIQKRFKESEICIILISNKLLELFLSHCHVLDTLILWSGTPDYITLTQALSGKNTCISRLTTLQIEGNYHDIDLFTLSQQCFHLKKLLIDVEVTYYGMNMLINLIQVQHNLEHFRLGFRPENNGFTNHVTPRLLTSLSSQTKTLHTIEFNRCNFLECDDLKELTECENIRHLILWKCVSIGPDKMRTLQNTNFSKLRRLEIYVHPGISADMVIKIIRESNNQLQSLRLAGITPQSDLIKVLAVMTINCQNLTDCRLVLKDGDNNAFNSLLSFLDVSNKLEILYITFTDRTYPICKYEEMAKHLPTGLHELVFRDFLFTPQSLEAFLENMNNSFQSLSFSKRYFTPAHIDIIIRYVKKNSNLFRLMKHSRYMSIKSRSTS
ncbi:7062_t:CDS:2, partial [Scutellospora calospora]